VTTPNPAGIRLERDGPVAHIILDRPEQHNALRAEEVAAFREFLDDLESDGEARVLLLSGSGDRTFCSGASLDQMESGEMSGAVFDTLTDRLTHLRLPTVCALNGNVYGGGAELALCCDFRIGAPGMRLSVPAARLGVCYPVGGLGRYVRRLGLATAGRILLANEEMDGRELYRIGFLSHLVDRDHVLPEATALAGRLADLAPLSVQGMKRIMLRISEGALDAEEAERLIARAAESEDVREGLRAARERRDPKFRGR
jgi:enoyl-CoA hydratase/carnithine racemase